MAKIGILWGHIGITLNSTGWYRCYIGFIYLHIYIYIHVWQVGDFVFTVESIRFTVL